MSGRRESENGRGREGRRRGKEKEGMRSRKGMGVNF